MQKIVSPFLGIIIYFILEYKYMFNCRSILFRKRYRLLFNTLINSLKFFPFMCDDYHIYYQFCLHEPNICESVKLCQLKFYPGLHRFP